MFNSRDYYVPTYNAGSVTESEDDFAYMPEKKISSATIIENSRRKRKADNVSNSEHLIKKIKQLVDDDEEINKELKSIYEKLVHFKRQKIGDVITWQDNDDNANKSALLDDNVNVILQARKAMMSADNEGVKIIIEQWGWEDTQNVRPKYSITIKRLKE